MDKKDGTILSVRDKLGQGFAETLEAQRLARQNKAEWSQSIIEAPLAGVNAYISVKEGKKVTGLTEQEVAFFEKASLSEMQSKLTTAKNEAFTIIEITEKERYIHDRAAKSYEEAQRLYGEAETAKELLDEWCPAVRITDWKGNPWGNEQKKSEGAAL